MCNLNMAAVSSFPPNHDRVEVFVLILILLASSGCTSTLGPVAGEGTGEGTQSSAGPTVGILRTLRPATSAPASIGTSAPTPSVIRWITSTPGVEISDEARLEQIIGLLKPGQNCRLPCVLGVTPGVSVLADVDRLFSTAGAKSARAELSDGSLLYVSSDLVPVRHGYYLELSVRDDPVAGRTRNVHLWFPGVYEQEALAADFAAYSPERVLEEYGSPNRIWLSLVSRDPGEVYSIFFFYDDVGFVTVYSATARSSDSSVSFCPAAHDTHRFFDLEIAAQAPGTETPLERLLELDPTMELPYIRSLEDASGLAPHELFEGVLAEGDSYCFETPKAVWSAR